MINLVLGIAIGAAFAPFWMKVYAYGKAKVMAALNKGD